MDIIRPATGGEARVAPGCNPGDIPLDWTDDDSALFVSERGQCVLKIFRVDVATGERREW